MIDFKYGISRFNWRARTFSKRVSEFNQSEKVKNALDNKQGCGFIMYLLYVLTNGV